MQFPELEYLFFVFSNLFLAKILALLDPFHFLVYFLQLMIDLIIPLAIFLFSEKDINFCVRAEGADGMIEIQEKRPCKKWCQAGAYLEKQRPKEDFRELQVSGIYFKKIALLEYFLVLLTHAFSDYKVSLFSKNGLFNLALFDFVL